MQQGNVNDYATSLATMPSLRDERHASEPPEAPRRPPTDHTMYRGKRLFDLTLAVTGLVVCAPFLVGVALMVYLEDRGSVFFIQDRVGRGGDVFQIWKFRSMRGGASRSGPSITIGGDNRVTRIGRILRATKIDELPQLVNVLRGEMSLVGPRPEVPEYVAQYNGAQREVLRLVPGITDLASIRYRNESEELASYHDPHRAYVEIIMPTKIAMNLWYSRRASFVRDVSVILASIGIRTSAFVRLAKAVPCGGQSWSLDEK